MIVLNRLIARTDFEAMRLRDGALSGRVRVLFFESDEQPPPVRVPELVTNVEVVHIAGRHVEALQRAMTEDEGCTLATRLQRFFAASRSW